MLVVEPLRIVAAENIEEGDCVYVKNGKLYKAIKEKKTIVRDLHIGGTVYLYNIAQGEGTEIIRLPAGAKITIQYEE